MKPEWGLKRTCPHCGARFYDLKRQPVICPKCSHPVEAEAAPRPRRSAPAVVVEAKPIPVVAEDGLPPVEAEREDPELIEEDSEAPAEGGESGEEEDEELIEDASDLGEDDDDMAEVMEHLDEDLEDEV